MELLSGDWLGPFLAAVVILVLRFALDRRFRENFKRDLAAAKAKRAAFRQKVDDRINAQQARNLTIAECVPPDNIARQIVESEVVDRTISGTYERWHALPNLVRLALCLPLSILVMALSYISVTPIVLAAHSFSWLKTSLYLAMFIPIFVLHAAIYLVMSRHRRLISMGFAAYYLLSSLVTFGRLYPHVGFWAVCYLGIFHCLAAASVARIWLSGIVNKPAVLIQRVGISMAASGLLNALLAIYVFLLLVGIQNGEANDLLSCPLLAFLMPLLKSIMTPIHLHTDNVSAVISVLGVVLLTWAGLWFCTGAFVAMARYKSLAPVATNAKSRKR